MKAKTGGKTSKVIGTLLGSVFLFCATLAARAQVSPAEMTDPEAKAAEARYFPQLQALNRAIASTKFPFPLVLSPYVGLDPSQQVGIDTRGIAFDKFQQRLLLRITGNYNAAFNARLLTANQRASHIMDEVMTPILGLVAREFRAELARPGGLACDAVGLEISYHVRRSQHGAEYEAKEILVVVLNKADAFRYPGASAEERQQILNRSDIFLNGKQFGLALAQRNPFSLEALDRSALSSPAAATAAAPSTVTSLSASQRSVNPERLRPSQPERESVPVGNTPAAPHISPGAVANAGTPGQPAPTAATQADVDRLQAQYQAQLDALGATLAAKFHSVSYAPPSFVLFQNRVYLQMTLRNPARFDRAATSIYKRAAQSFDLFLAPQLKGLLAQLPNQGGFYGLDMTVLNPFSDSSSEAVEYLCPLAALEQFADAEITNQQLIDQSVVLVNGVRIALNLQAVE